MAPRRRMAPRSLGVPGGAASHAASRRRAPLALALGLVLVLAVFGRASSAHAAESLGGISGEVSSASSHAPVAGLMVCAISTNYKLLDEEERKHAIACAKTGAGGEYTIGELRPESYYVAFDVLPEGFDYIPQLYNGAYTLSQSTPVQVLAGETTPSIDAELALGAEISGTVTDLETGAPIDHVNVCALRSGGQAEAELASCAESEASGAYTLRGLSSGSYQIGFFAAGFETGYYHDKAHAAEAESVSVIAPQLTQGIDDALKPGGEEGPEEPGSAPTPGSTHTASTPESGLPGTLTSSPSGGAGASTLSLASTRVAVAHRRDALVTVQCSGAAGCRAKLTLELQTTLTVKGKRTRRSVTIGTSAVLSVAAGAKITAEIPLDAKGRRLLQVGHGRLSVELVLATLAGKRSEKVMLEAGKARR